MIDTNLSKIEVYKTSYYNRNNYDSFYEHLFNPAVPTYVRIDNDSMARYGTIGIAVPKGADPTGQGAWPVRAANTDNYGYYKRNPTQIDIYIDSHQMLDTSMVSNRVVWLNEYTGPVSWQFNRKPGKPSVDAYDALGNLLSVGDFVTYAYKRSREAELYFGQIEKITKAGVVYCRNMQLDDKTYQFEARIKGPTKISKLNKDILNELMIRRLTY